MARVIRRTQQAFNQPIGVVNMDTGADQVGLAFAEAGEQLRRTAFKIDAQEAKRVGEETAAAADLRALDANGKPVALGAPEGFGRIARESYRNVIERRFFEQMDSDIRLKSKELAVKYDRSPLEYDNAMQAYLDGMAKNSEGRFQRFIIDAGTVVKESTHLGLVKQARDRARVQSAEHIVATNAEAAEQIAIDAREGKFDAVDAHIEQRVQATKDGEGAGLKVGSSLSVADDLGGKAAAAYLKTQLNGLTAAQRKQLVIHLSGGGGELTGVLAEVYGDVSKYINSNNVKGVIVEVEALNSDLAALEAIQDKIADDNARRAAQNYINDLENVSDRLQVDSTQDVIDSFVDESMSIDQAIRNARERIGVAGQKIDREAATNEFFVNPELRKDEIRRDLIAPMITRAAAEGNSEAFRSALVNGPTLTAMMSQLTDNQREVVIGLHKYGLLQAGNQEDAGFFSPLISQSSSSLNEAMQRQQTEVDFQRDYLNLLTEMDSPNFDPEDVVRFIGAAEKAGVDPTRVESFRQGFSFNAAKQEFSKLALSAGILSENELGSTAVDRVIQYINTGGESELAPDVASLVDSNLAGLNTIQRENIETHLRSISSDMKKDESRLKAERDLAQDVNDFANGSLERTGVKSKNIAEAVLTQRMGFDLSNRETITPEVIGLMAQRSIPTSVFNGLKAMADGQPTANAENLLYIANQLANYNVTITSAGITTNNKQNVLSGFFSADDQAVLNEILIATSSNIYATAEEAILEVAKLHSPNASGAQERVANLLMNEEGKKITASKFVANIIDDDDVMLTKELGQIATLLAGRNFSKSQIEREILGRYNRHYSEAGFVYDGTRPIGNRNRSKYSLNQVASQDEERLDYLQQSLEGQLNALGYTLHNHVEDESTTKGYRPVVLVPLFANVPPQRQQYAVNEIVDEGGVKVLEQVVTPHGIGLGFNMAEELAEYQSSALSIEVKDGKTLQELGADMEIINWLKENGPMSGGF